MYYNLTDTYLGDGLKGCAVMMPSLKDYLVDARECWGGEVHSRTFHTRIPIDGVDGGVGGHDGSGVVLRKVVGDEVGAFVELVVGEEAFLGDAGDDASAEGAAKGVGAEIDLDVLEQACIVTQYLVDIIDGYAVQEHQCWPVGVFGKILEKREELVGAFYSASAYALDELHQGFPYVVHLGVFIHVVLIVGLVAEEASGEMQGVGFEPLGEFLLHGRLGTSLLEVFLGAPYLKGG